MSRWVRWLLGAAIVAGLGHGVPGLGHGAADAAECDRTCLARVMTRYLGALVAHDPQSAPLAPNVRLTEDAVQLEVGEGLWKTASKLRPYRVDFIDVRQGVAAVHTVVEENGAGIVGRAAEDRR